MFKNLKIIKLENRALLKIQGEDSKEFLQALVTNNINFISNDKSIYSALLSPQGKYLYDFFIFQDLIDSWLPLSRILGTTPYSDSSGLVY